MRRQLLIFDLDGTLIDSRKDLATAVNLMRQHFGLPPIPVEQVVRYIGDGVRMLVTRSLEGASVDIEDALRVQGPLYRQHLADETVLYPGVHAGLLALHAAGHVLAMATNKPVDASETILTHFGIRPFFALVLGGGSTAKLKPAPDMIQTIMDSTGIPAADTWIIGDNHTDLECARRAGVRSVFCSYGFGNRGSETPFATIASFDELAGVI